MALYIWVIGSRGGKMPLSRKNTTAQASASAFKPKITERVARAEWTAVLAFPALAKALQPMPLLWGLRGHGSHSGSYCRLSCSLPVSTWKIRIS